MTAWVEPVALAIVAAYLLGLARREPAERAGLLSAYAFLALGGWLGEVSCIRAYEFYAYAPGWRLWLDVVPLAVVATWPVVILTALELARSLNPARPAALCALIVLADAALIEPVAVRAGLWSWNAPGLFEVPPIGVLGWAFFTLASAAWLERGALRPAVVLVGPVACHALLLLSWWGALRWLDQPWPDWAGPAAAWPAALLAAWAARRVTPPWGRLLARLPGALFFLALLALHGRRDGWLVGYALAFPLPYLALFAARGEQVTRG